MNNLAQESLSALRWQLDMGVDETLADAPINWFDAKTTVEPIALTPAQASPARPVVKAASKAPIAESRSGAIAEARALADKATTLEALKEAITSFDGCALKKTAMNMVFADGAEDAAVMAIGEAPGAEEDRQGIPFCAEHGQLFDKMFGAIGLNRAESLYISNMLYWRPPGNRKPNADEIEICRPFVEKHIALKKPELLVLVGGTAANALLGETQGITRLRGKAFEYTNNYLEGVKIPVHVLFHPSYLMRQPAQKALAWQDLLQIKTALK